MRSLLVVAAAVMGFWNWNVSVFALWSRRPNKDRFHFAYIVALLIAVTLFAVLPFLSQWWLARVLAGGLLVYRILDIYMNLVHYLVFGYTRVDPRSNSGDLSLAEAQSDLFLVSFVYMELLFLFAALYHLLSVSNPAQFVPWPSDAPAVLLSRSSAFHLSLATQTTVGYGLFAPLQATSIALCTAQTCIGLIALGAVVARMVNITAARRSDDPEMERGITPIVSTDRIRLPGRWMWLLLPLALLVACIIWSVID